MKQILKGVALLMGLIIILPLLLLLVVSFYMHVISRFAIDFLLGGFDV